MPVAVSHAKLQVKTWFKSNFYSQINWWSHFLTFSIYPAYHSAYKEKVLWQGNVIKPLKILVYEKIQALWNWDIDLLLEIVAVQFTFLCRIFMDVYKTNLPFKLLHHWCCYHWSLTNQSLRHYLIPCFMISWLVITNMALGCYLFKK